MTKILAELKKYKKNRSTRLQFFRLQNSTDARNFYKLLKSNQIQHVVDDYDEQCRELFAIQNPTLAHDESFEKKFSKHKRGLSKITPMHQQGVWVFYEWLSAVVHILDEAEFYAVRTARNKYLITNEEQEAFYNCHIGIGGLSVGNSIILTMVLEGGAKNIRLADMDKLALSNTNRIRTSLADLGSYKVDMTKRQIYEINPFAKVEVIREGLNENTFEKFFIGKKKLDLVIDELDNLAIKYRIREWAKKLQIPVIMAADNGDSGVVDVERYDLDQRTSFFHNRMGDVSYDNLAQLDKFAIGKKITEHVGVDNVDEKMQHSLMEMGKSVVSWPQLGGTAMLNGAAMAYIARRILNNQKVINNRSIISLDKELNPDYFSEDEINKRKNAQIFFKKIFGI